MSEISLHAGSGNRCGHHPEQPNFLTQRHSERMPLILQRAIERIPTLYSRELQIASLDTLNDSRRKRTERREAWVQTLKVLVKYLDLVTMTVCIPSDGGEIGLTLKRLHKETTISFSRFKRALADLRRAGLLTLRQPRTVTRAGEVRGLCAIKAVSVKLFAALKLNLALKKERDKASKRQRAKASKSGTTQRAFYQSPSCQAASNQQPDITAKPADGQSFPDFVAAQRSRPPR